MSFLSRLTGTARADRLATAALYALDGGTPAAEVVNAPAGARWAFGVDLGQDRVDRATAMTIPAVRRGRQVIAGTIGALSLNAHRTWPDGRVDDVTADRPLLVQPDRNTTRQYVLSWTVDDLLFYGIAWWRVTDRDAAGFPRRVERLTRDRVSWPQLAGQPGTAGVDQRVRVDGVPVEDRDLIRFDGPDEGVLTYGGRTLRTCLLLEDAVRRFARLDVPLGILKLAEDAQELSSAPGSAQDGTDRSQVDALLDAWESARAERTTAYLNRAVDYQAQQFNAEQLQLDQVRQYQAAEVARLLNLAPRYVNAPNASGMTYANVQSERQDLVDTTLVGYLAAIEQRLSMPDVTPNLTAVRFDTGQLLRGDLASALNAAQVAVGMGAMTKAEVRADVLGRPPLEDPAAATPTAAAASQLLDLVASLPPAARDAIADAIAHERTNQ